MAETAQASPGASHAVTYIADSQASSSLPLLHLIYIHGFQGDDTSFQSFPLHLQDHLSTIVSQNPSKYPFRVQSSLYPTYKSIKHLSYATTNFLEWLQTQPPGPVILIGHSMGGLLAAEAALHSADPPLAPGGKPRRIVGIIAFDVPFLGMHPHVVISGLASLLPKGDSSDEEDENDKTPSQSSARPGNTGHNADKEMDAHPEINLVSSQVTDEWEEFKKKIHRKRNPRSPNADGDSYLDIPARDGSRSSSPSSSIRSASPSSPGASSTFSKLSSSSSRLSGRRSPFLAKALDYASPYISQATSYLQSHADDPLARWIIKHSSSSDSEGLVKASKRWVVERMQFGGCMFDPKELKERYEKLLKWGGTGGGIWINYYTVTEPKALAQREKEKERSKRRDEALAESGLAPPPNGSGEETHPKDSGKLKKSKEAKVKGAEKEERDLEKEKGHHFVMLPSSSVFVQAGQNTFPGRVSADPLDSWPQVVISGAADEVEAHCGLFIPKLNLEYENFVRAVGEGLLGWCERERDDWGLNGS